jgi:hypothetical protein
MGLRGLPDGAFWLGRWGIGGRWPSFALGGLCFLFFGFLVVPGLFGVVEFEGLGRGGGRVEDFYNGFLADAFFLVMCAFLGVNVPGRRDAFSSRLLFLRELPIPAGSVVVGRAISTLFALAINASAFFLPAYLLSDLGDLGASYLLFAGVWIGYGLLASGLWLLLELTAKGGARAPVFIGCVLALVAVVALLGWTASLELVGGTVGLVRGYGALPAVLSVLAGAAAFALLAGLTVRRLRKRDVFWDPWP